MRFVATLLMTAAVIGAPASAAAQEDIQDPWEGMNRGLYAVHDAVDRAVLEPAAKAYRYATPRVFRTGVSNFLNNLSSPITLANDVLQGEMGRAGNTAARLGVNTTIGVLGILDPATDMGLERHTEDFGQTLAVWGTPSGPYLFVPLVGPTTVRDGAARVVDIAFNPLSWAQFDEKGSVSVGIATASALSTRESLIESIDDVRESSLDPYVTFRSSYILFRESAIQNGQTDVQDLPDFTDIPISDDVAPIAEEGALDESEPTVPDQQMVDQDPTEQDQPEALEQEGDEERELGDRSQRQELGVTS